MDDSRLVSPPSTFLAQQKIDVPPPPPNPVAYLRECFRVVRSDNVRVASFLSSAHAHDLLDS